MSLCTAQCSSCCRCEKCKWPNGCRTEIPWVLILLRYPQCRCDRPMHIFKSAISVAVCKPGSYITKNNITALWETKIAYLRQLYYLSKHCPLFRSHWLTDENENNPFLPCVGWGGKQARKFLSPLRQPPALILVSSYFFRDQSENRVR